MTQGLAQRIIDAEQAMVELTQDLIRIPTINPPGEYYRDICELLAKWLKPHGFDLQFLRAEGALGDSDRYPRWNLIARHQGRHAGDCVHFNSHTDVVTVGNKWTVDPFAGEVRDGRIYGRGACDMKGGLASSMVAAACFVAEHPNYHGAIEISGTCDEESGGFGGVAWLAEQGYFNPDRVQHVIIPEPLHKDRICLGHRGVWWAEIETRGHIAHGSMPFLGDCAVRHMNAIIDAFERELWPRLAEKHTEMPVIPELARQATLNLNSIHGGLDEPDENYTGLPSALVPDSCRMVIDRRFLLEESIDSVQAEIRELIDTVSKERGAEVNLRELFTVLPNQTDENAPIVQATRQAIQNTLGKEPEYVCSPGSYDQKHINRIGRLHNCIAYGPGILDLAHQPDEYIGIQDMMDATQVMGQTLETLLLSDET